MQRGSDDRRVSVPQRRIPHPSPRVTQSKISLDAVALAAVGAASDRELIATLRVEAHIGAQLRRQTRGEINPRRPQIQRHRLARKRG